MTIKERMSELIEHGAAIQIQDPKIALTLAGALWLGNPTRLRWCAIFPEDQHHIHETAYDEAQFDNDGRDILFYRASVLVVSVVPYEEGPLDVGEVRDALAEWQTFLDKYDETREEFAHFLRTA